MEIAKPPPQTGKTIPLEIPARRIRSFEPLLDRCALISDPRSLIPKMLSLVQSADANYPIEKVGRNLSRVKEHVRERHLDLLRGFAEKGEYGQPERAMRVLGDLRDSASIPILMSRLRQGDILVSTEAAIAIGKMAGELSPDQRSEITRMAGTEMPKFEDYKEVDDHERMCAAGMVALAEMGDFRTVFVYMKKYLVGKADESSELHITEDRVVRAAFLALGRKAQASRRSSKEISTMIRKFENSKWFGAHKRENDSVYKALGSHFAELRDARKSCFSVAKGKAKEYLHYMGID